MFNVVGTLFAAAAVITATPALADTQTVAYGTQSPVALASFDVNSSLATGSIGNDSGEVPRFIATGITLKFINRGGVPATTVKFLLGDGRSAQSIVDEGTFSPGVVVKHQFSIDTSDELADAACRVVEVDFADGTAWRSAPRAVASR